MKNNFRFTLILSGIALVTVGCSAVAPLQPASMVEPPAVVATGAPTDTSAGQSASAASREAAKQPLSHRFLPRRSRTAPLQLVGLESDAVEEIFGAPSLRRQEQPAQYWRYSYTGCTVDLFFYRETPGSAFKVTHFEFRPSAGDGVAERSHCERLADQVETGQGWENADMRSH